MKPNNRNALALALLTMGVVATAPAMAGCDLTDGGFLAQAIKCVAPSSAPIMDSLDRLNGQWGNPVDHAIARGAEAIVPGAGTALESG